MTTTYKGLLGNDFADWRLRGHRAGRKTAQPPRATNLIAMPSRTQITRHDCVEGWSCIAKWTGVPLALVLDQAKREAGRALRRLPLPRSRSSAACRATCPYYGSIDLVDACHPQTILAYGLNGKPLPVENGAPLRVRVERAAGLQACRNTSTASSWSTASPRLRLRQGRLLGRPRLRLVRRHLTCRLPAPRSLTPPFRAASCRSGWIDGEVSLMKRTSASSFSCSRPSLPMRSASQRASTLSTCSARRAQASCHWLRASQSASMSTDCR